MEKFSNENSKENGEGISLTLYKKQIGYAFWGKSVETAAGELIKIRSIINYTKEKGVKTKGEFEIIVSDLFKEFNITVLKYNVVFTDNIVNQILHSDKIDTISLEFNKELLIAKSDSTVESVVAEWKKKGIDSTESIESRELETKNKKEAAVQQQAFLDKMISELDSVDFTNQEKLIDWLYEYYGHYTHGVDMHQDELLEKFKIEGYVPEDNDAVNGMLGETLKDKKRLGKVIIGYLLTNGTLALRGTGLQSSIAEWKNL